MCHFSILRAVRSSPWKLMGHSYFYFQFVFFYFFYFCTQCSMEKCRFLLQIPLTKEELYFRFFDRKCFFTEFPMFYLLCLLPSLSKEVFKRSGMLAILRCRTEAVLAGGRRGCPCRAPVSRTICHLPCSLPHLQTRPVL